VRGGDLNGQYALVLVGQLSDTHLLCDPSARRWGHNPAENLASVMNALPPVDAIVVTGDIADDGSVEAYRLADALTAGKSARRYFIAGNHDDRSMMRAVFGEVDEVRVVELSERWSLVLLNSQWVGHEAGYVTDSVLDRLASDLDRVENHVLLCLHHPPLSPCPQPDCGLRDSDRLLEVLHGGPVRAVLSGHVHQDYEFAHEGITFLGAPSTFGQASPRRRSALHRYRRATRCTTSRAAGRRPHRAPSRHRLDRGTNHRHSFRTCRVVGSFRPTSSSRWINHKPSTFTRTRLERIDRRTRRSAAYSGGSRFVQRAGATETAERVSG
jgi:3',5'-cyclic-AMP phosphodiesterase